MTVSNESATATTNEESTNEQRLSTADLATGADKTPVERQSADRADSGRQPDSERREALFPGTEAQGFQGRWSEIQVAFVDEPRQSVEKADALVAEVMQRLAQVFADERSRLEQQWDRGEDTDTEALRQSLRRYRSFFDRLLSM